MSITKNLVFFFRPNENCTEFEIIHAGSDLRLNPLYIIIYVHWVWTITTVILPLIILITLSTRIYQGLIKVKKNLNRHKRLVERAETAETIGDKSPQQRATRCTLKLDVINEQDQMEGNLFAIIF